MNFQYNLKLQAYRITAPAVVLFFSLVSSSHAVDLDSRTLRYSVVYSGHDAGELEVIIERTDNVIKTTAISHLSGFAQIFLSGQTVQTWFRIEGDNVLLDKGHILDHKSENITNSFTIDRDKRIIDYHTREDEPIQEGDMFAATSFPIILMTSVATEIGGKTIRETNPKKSRYYVFHEPVSEPLELNGKDYKTWKITRNKRGQPDRTVTYWLNRRDQKVPLKIVSTKDGKSTVMTLLNPS